MSVFAALTIFVLVTTREERGGQQGVPVVENLAPTGQIGQECLANTWAPAPRASNEPAPALFGTPLTTQSGGKSRAMVNVFRVVVVYLVRVVVVVFVRG